MDSDKIDKLNRSILDIEQSAIDLKSFSKAYSEIEKLQDKISLNLLSSENNQQQLIELIELLKNTIKENSRQLSDIQNLIETKIDTLYKDNKSFQKELDSTLITRLEKSKSDIQIELRDVESRLQSSVKSEVNNAFRELESNQKREFEKQSKESKTLKNFLIALTILVLISIAATFI